MHELEPTADEVAAAEMQLQSTGLNRDNVQQYMPQLEGYLRDATDPHIRNAVLVLAQTTYNYNGTTVLAGPKSALVARRDGDDDDDEDAQSMWGSGQWIASMGERLGRIRRIGHAIETALPVGLRLLMQVVGGAALVNAAIQYGATRVLGTVIVAVYLLYVCKFVWFCVRFVCRLVGACGLFGWTIVQEIFGALTAVFGRSGVIFLGLTIYARSMYFLVSMVWFVCAKAMKIAHRAVHYVGRCRCCYRGAWRNRRVNR